MADREKVLLALEYHKKTTVCNGCPYAGDDDTPEGYCPVYDDAIALLREQEESIPVSWLTEKLEGHPEISYAVTDGINHVLTLWEGR